MKCKDCPYYWADCDEEGAVISNEYCHYQYNDGYAPCEIDDDYDTPDED